MTGVRRIKMTDRTGQQLGNYSLTRLLGRGGFADVYLGEHIYLGTNAAIKVLQTRLSNEAELEWFVNEARTVARLSHPNIVRVLDFGVDNETPFLVIEYAPNGTLRERHLPGTILPISTIVPYVKQVADALQYAHDEKLIHRDVKPENMLLGRRNEVLLNDFGIALIAQSTRNQSMQDLAGTVTYIAPEQIQGKPRPASDQYSLGIVVYEWLSGGLPFSGSLTELCTQHLFASPPPLKEKVPTIEPAVEQVVNRALAKDPKQRYESISAFANALAEAASAEPMPSTIEGAQASDRLSSTSISTPISPPPSLQMPTSNRETPRNVSSGNAPMTNAGGSVESIAPKSNLSESARRARVFVQRATPDTIRQNYTIIDNPLTNGDPNAILMVTQNWNPGGGNGTYNNHPVGVGYDGVYWAIFNEDLAPMTAKACFNVKVLSQDASVFVQVATDQNSIGNYTVIDHPLTNGNPNAIVMVTQNWNPGGKNVTYNNHPVGVWYTPAGKWSIFNEDKAPMPLQAAFNVQVLNPSSLAFVHQTTSSNVGDDYTFFKNGATDGDPNAIVMVTQNWNPQGKGGMYNSHEVGVWYTRSNNWAIFNVDYAPMALQASFNVEIVEV
jgi:serine/threonine protein kinase